MHQREVLCRSLYYQNKPDTKLHFWRSDILDIRYEIVQIGGY